MLNLDAIFNWYDQIRLHDSLWARWHAGSRLIGENRQKKDKEIMAIHAHFTVTDFIVFSLTLLASMGIGIFYSRSGGAQQNNDEYLMAGRSMSSLPVAVSVLASFVSSIAILGNPAEVYAYGFQYWIQCFTNFISVPIMALVFLPVYYNLRLTSSYEVSEPPVVSV